MGRSFTDYNVVQPNLEATRASYAKFHERLETIVSAEDCLELMTDWDRVVCEFSEWSSLTYIRFHQNTSDAVSKAEKEKLNEVLPKFAELETKFKQALLDSPLRSEIEKLTGKQLFAKWECDTRSFSPEIEEDLSTELKLQSEYTALTAGAKILFRGESYTLSEMNQFYDQADREMREEAYRESSRWYAENAVELDRIYDDQVKLRHTMAQKIGYQKFTEMGYQRMKRIGYGPNEVAQFRNEVRDKVVPLAMAFADQQSQILGVESLMYWDTTVFSLAGNPAPLGGHDWMVDRATEMFGEMGHGLPEFFEEMKTREAMDLKSREGKAGGGFCDFLPQFGFPFIFANFNGTRGDVDVFTHEVGHAFQSYSSRKQVMSDLIWPTTEACEIHSMGLEFLTWPYMDKFYGEEAAEELRRIHLTHYFQFLPYGVAIDHFQHLVYESPEASPEERNEMWKEIESIYLSWWRYKDLPHEESGRAWQQKQHIYQSPFYYIDYCLALTGALQFWSKSRQDSEATLHAYAQLCTLGGSRDYKGLLDSAGLNSPFESGCLDGVIADAQKYLR